LLTYTEEIVNCDGSVADIISALQCSLPLTVLGDTPYSLVSGDSIFAKIVAINFYGESAASDGGNGAIIAATPFAPINLLDSVDVTTAYIIGFTWSDGSSNGGYPIIDYRISYDQSTGTFVELEDGVTERSY
jgi:hypothetical protein